MTFSQIILPPLVGGVIGYATNSLAIKMLFRPFKPVYIGRLRLPFTPGIVARRLPQLADALGREVERQFFNADDLEVLFKSDAFSATVAGSIADSIYTKKTTLCFQLEAMEREPEYAELTARLKHELSRHIVEALSAFDYTPMITRAIKALAEESRSIIKSKASNTISGIAPAISESIRQYLRDKGAAAVEPFIEEQLTNFADRPVKEIAEDILNDRDYAAELIRKLYNKFMSVYVRRIVESIDVGGMITQKLLIMDLKAVETLILSVVSREFQYVIWLGGLLGFIIGTVNIFI